MQRALAGIQTSVHRKEELISEIALIAETAYEDVAPFVENKDEKNLQNPLKRPDFFPDWPGNTVSPKHSGQIPRSAWNAKRGNYKKEVIIGQILKPVPT